MHKIALKKIQQNPLRSALLTLSITIGTTALIISLALTNGIKQATFDDLQKQSPLTQITVRQPANSTISLFSNSNRTFTEEDIEEISSISGVEAVYPEKQFPNFAALEASIFDFTLTTDTMVFTVPAEFVNVDPQTWETDEEPYPVVIPRKILDLYNLAIATPRGLPALNEEGLQGRNLTLYPNFSTFFPGASRRSTPVTLEVVGFSDKTNLLGITISDNALKNILGENNETQTITLELFVEVVDSTQTAQVAEKIEELGFTTEYFQKNLQEVEARFTYLQTALGTISAIIILTAAIAIINTFLAVVSERRREIGLLRALGATRSQIRSLILSEAFILGLLGSLLAATLSLSLTPLLNKNLGSQLTAATTTDFNNLLNLSPQLLLTGLLFGTLLSLIAALLPAQKASNIEPVQALK